jgi:hypothetical protein
MWQNIVKNVRLIGGMYLSRKSVHDELRREVISSSSCRHSHGLESNAQRNILLNFVKRRIYVIIAQSV